MKRAWQFDLDSFRVDVPEGKRGKWKVDRFTVTEDAAAMFNLSLAGAGNRRIKAGRYTRLLYGGFNPMMSDTPAEIRDHAALLEGVQTPSESNEVLIMGLGLGVCVGMAFAADPNIRVTVIENSPDVIALVAPHYQARYGDRFRVIEADALTWQPPRGAKYRAVWFDIWPAICTDNLPDMTKLRRRFAKRAAWTGAWCQSECQREARKERRYAYP